MRRHFTLGLILTVGLFAVGIRPGVSQAQELNSSLSGQIVLQVEEQGQAWYVNPSDQLRYFLGRPADAFQIMQKLGVGISDADLELIPKSNQTWDGRTDVMARVRGKIVLQVEQHGEAWYVNPINGKRYFLGRPADAFQLMTKFGKGITNENLWIITPEVGVAVVQPKGVSDPLDEFVEIKNGGQLSRSLDGWILSDGSTHQFTFPSGTTLTPGKSVHARAHQPR